MAVQPIPSGYHSITPYLTIRGVGALLEFAEKAFGATVVERITDGSGAIRHAELRIGDSRVMVGECPPDQPTRPGMLYHYLVDIDAAFARAVAAGATVIQPVATQFYGDRTAGLADPCGNQWWLATHVEDVSGEEVARRMAARQK